MELPDIPLDAFHLCTVRANTVYEVGYTGLSFMSGQSIPCTKPDHPLLTKLGPVTSVMIVYYAIRSKSQYGMPHIIKTVVEDTTIYFFVMALCYLVLALFVIFAKVDTLISEGARSSPSPIDHHKTLTHNVGFLVQFLLTDDLRLTPYLIAKVQVW